MNNFRYTIDSSVIISSFLEKEKFFDISRSFLSMIVQEENVQFIMPTIVFLEIVNVLKKIACPDINKVIDLLESNLFNWINIDLDFVHKVISDFNNPSLKTSDLIVAATAKFYDAKLVSWDKKLINNSKKIGITAFQPY